MRIVSAFSLLCLIRRSGGIAGVSALKKEGQALRLARRYLTSAVIKPLKQEAIMAIGDLKNILHKIKVWLYPNYLPGAEGAYLARTDNEATLSVEDVCTALKNRGGYQGKFSVLVDIVKQFIDEFIYQLLDGYAVSMGYFSLHPNIGGTFSSEMEAFDPKKHPITIRFRPRMPLRNLIPTIDVEIQGIAETGGYIAEFNDFEAESVNTLYVPGNQFAIYGNKIKLAGDDPEVGVYFVPVDDPSKAVKVTRIAENNPSKITGIAPQTTSTSNRIEIRTQFTGASDKILKTPRTIVSNFVLEET